MGIRQLTDVNDPEWQGNRIGNFFIRNEKHKFCLKFCNFTLSHLFNVD